MEDELDYSGDVIKWLNKEEFKALRIKKYKFIEEKIREYNIFRIRENKNYIYVNEKFKDICLSNKLEGISFILVYDSGKQIEYPFNNIY